MIKNILVLILELTPEQQKLLIELRRKKQELLLEIQVIAAIKRKIIIIPNYIGF
jgi:ribosomal protein S19